MFNFLDLATRESEGSDEGSDQGSEGDEEGFSKYERGECLYFSPLVNDMICDGAPDFSADDPSLNNEHVYALGYECITKPPG